MNAATRNRLSVLETVLIDLDWQEQLGVERLRRSGWSFSSIPAARRYMAQLRAAERSRRELLEMAEGSRNG